MKRWHIVVLSVAVVLVAGFFVVRYYVQSTSTWAQGLTWSNPDLSLVSDGTYEGSSALTLPPGTAAANTKTKVRVTVRDHRIAAVEILEPPTLANSMRDFASTVIDRQSVRPDNISGATVSKITVLMAIANAVGR